MCSSRKPVWKRYGSMRRRKSLLEKAVARPKATKPVKPIPYDMRLFEDADLVLRAKHLATVYASLRHLGPGWAHARLPSDRSYRSFLRAAQTILDYEKATCRRVNNIDYVMSHIWYWGKTCWTTRLSSSSSIALYDAFTRLHSAQWVHPDPEADQRYEQELVQYLSRLRNESESLIRRSLKGSGLLSP